MKITKYNQSCLLIESEGGRVLVDPGDKEYNSELVEKEWVNIDGILVTHKHTDHIELGAIDKILTRDKAILHTSKEVKEKHKLKSCHVVAAEDVFKIGNLNIEVTYALHGYLPKMRGNEVLENIGFIIKDSKTRLYITSDTIGFPNNYKCDVICMPFNGGGLTLGVYDGALFAKETEAKLVIPVHTEHPILKVDIDEVQAKLKEEGMECQYLEVFESIIL